MDISYAVESIQNTCREFNEVAYRLQDATPERARLIFEGACTLGGGWESLENAGNTPIGDALQHLNERRTEKDRAEDMARGKRSAAALALASEWLLDAALERAAAQGKPAPSEARPA